MWVAVILLASMLTFCSCSARMGYKASIEVDGTSYEIERSISNMQFQSDDSIRGEGYFSKYKSIGDPGTSTYSEEITSGLQGKVSKESIEGYQSIEGPVKIVTSLDSEANSAFLNVDENWQTAIINRNIIEYEGSRALFRTATDRNQDELIKIRLMSKKMITDTDFRAQLTRMNLNVNINHNGLKEEKLLNATTLYGIQLGNIGTTELLFHDKENAVEQIFSGNYRFSAAMNKTSVFRFYQPNKTESWLPCCFGSELS